MQEEQALVRRAAGGDPDAFEELVTAYEKQVYHLALRMTANPDDAMDLSQETFLRAWRGLASYRSDSAFSTWLYRLASNVCIDFLRRQKKQKVVPLYHTDDEEEERELSLPQPGPGPEEQILRQLEQEQVAQALAQLEPEYRQALTLCVIQGLSYTEIAQVLGIKEGTVKSRIARAREKMRNILQKSGNNRPVSSSKQRERRKDTL